MNMLTTYLIRGMIIIPNKKESEGRMFKKADRTFNFRQSWSTFELIGIEKHLQDKFKEHFHIRDIDDYFGLPYENSSSFAMISNTNTKFHIEPDIQLEYFALEGEDVLVAVGWDENENEHFYYVV